MMCPCGRRISSSFALSTTCRFSPVKNDSRPSVLALDVAQVRPNRSVISASVRSRLFKIGRALNSVARFAGLRDPVGRATLGLGNGERAIDERQVGGRRRGGVVLLEPSEEAVVDRRPRLEPQWRVLDHRHRMLVLVPPPRQRGSAESGGELARARRQAVEVQRIGREAHAAPKRADHRPRISPAHRRF